MKYRGLRIVKENAQSVENTFFDISEEMIKNSSQSEACRNVDS